MKRLTDYGGEFCTNLKLGDFSPDTLTELVVLYSKLYRALDGFWYITIKERFSNEEALACDLDAWGRLCKYEMAKITEKLNIRGNDVIALMKAIQTNPWFQSRQFSIEVKGHNNAILTIAYCPTLDALEREGNGREKDICNIACTRGYKNYASFFDPDIAVTCLKSPPRENKDDISCQWEFLCSE
ncbi:DUF6125 family protein [Chloroflexota bacterium]